MDRLPLLSRAVFSAFACAAIVWGATVLLVQRRSDVVEAVARRIIAGEPFKTDVLAAFLADLDHTHQPGRAATCHPAFARGVAVVRLRILENAIDAGQRDRIDKDIDDLRTSVRQALACAPSDAFLWLVLFWIENAQHGFSPANLEYLRKSYLLGPNEGWVVVKRARLALALFERLPPDLADAASAEFARLVESGLMEDALAILSGPGWRIREHLLQQLRDTPEQSRRMFALALFRRGYDLEVPGVPRRERRPW